MWTIIWRIVCNTIKDIRRIHFLFGSLGSFIGIFGIGYNYFGQSKEKSIEYGCYFLLVIFVYQIIKHAYKILKEVIKTYYFDNVWGDGIILIREINKDIRHFENGTKQIDVILRNICNNLKIYYDKRTGSACSVSIKIPQNPGANIQDLVVKNVCRDKESALVRDTEVYKNIEHKVFQNTAYVSVIQRMLKGKGIAYYINNNIDTKANYETTSLSAYPEEKLPYSSELVFPIRSLSTENEEQMFDLSGFLCIDCKDEGKFTTDKYTLQLMSVISNELFRIIRP